MTHPCIEVSKVHVLREGNRILDVDQLAVAAGEIVAVVGPNGAGKSTLVRVMGLLIHPDGGAVTVGGNAVTKKNAYALRKKVACVFQSPHLLDRTVLANVELGMKLRGIPPSECTHRARKWIASLGLERLVSRRARTLSGGEAQRVNLARALALAPELLLLDEPLGGLDAPTRHNLVEELGPLIRQGAGGGLLVTHDRRVALALGDRVAVMLDGQIRQLAPPDEVFSRPRDEDVARFVGVENLLPAIGAGKEVHLDNGTVLIGEGELDGPVLLSLRAEEVRPLLGQIPPESPNVLQGKVNRVFKRGVGFAAEIDAGVKLISRLTRSDHAILGIAEGDTIKIQIRPAALHRIPRTIHRKTP